VLQTTVTFLADGLHADGNGARAVTNDLAHRLALDPRVAGVSTGHPNYVRPNRAALDEVGLCSPGGEATEPNTEGDT
jgi:hypothetical protein